MPTHDTSATRVVASVLGVIAGISGLDHGFFELLQGNAPTPGLFVESIGPGQRMWQYGTEDAFTLIPNFLVTGAAAIAVGLIVIVWSIGFIDGRFGSRVLAVFGALLFLAGGGVAQVGFAVLCWAVSTRISRPPAWVRSNVRAAARARLARWWPEALAIAVALAAVALEVAITGFVPGLHDPMAVQAVCWSALVLMLVPLGLAVLGAFAQDLARSSDGQANPSIEPATGR